MIMPYNTLYNPSPSFTILAKTFKISSKLVAFLAQQVPLIAQKVPLVVTIGPLICLDRFYNLFNKMTIICSIYRLFSVNVGE